MGLMKQMMRIKDLIKFSETELEKISDTPSLDSTILISHILKKDKAYLLSHNEDLVSKTQIFKLNKLLKLRKDKKPISYLLNNKEFYNLYYFVNQYTLIPRPETELLVEECLKTIGKNGTKPVHILEIGTGSGCIPISIIYNTEKNIHIDTIDISRKALSVAKLNSINLLSAKKREQISFQNHNILKYIPKKKYDIIISNPPYITSKELSNLDIGIVKYEPRRALFGGENGLLFYQRIKSMLSLILKNDGVCLLEINDSLEHEITDIFSKLYSTEIINDYAKLPRIIKIF
jgi:release factor glutamine methyltransferase